MKDMNFREYIKMFESLGGEKRKIDLYQIMEKWLGSDADLTQIAAMVFDIVNTLGYEVQENGIVYVNDFNSEIVDSDFHESINTVIDSLEVKVRSGEIDDDFGLELLQQLNAIDDGEKNIDLNSKINELEQMIAKEMIDEDYGLDLLKDLKNINDLVNQ